MPVGEILLGAVLQALFQELTSRLITAFARREGIYNQLRKWSQTLKIISAVLDDAEDRQLTEKAVTVWLEMLRDLAFDLDDVLDEIRTKALIENQDAPLPMPSKFLHFIPSCNRFSPGALIYNYRMTSKLKEVTNRLQYLYKQKNDLNLRESVSGVSNNSVRRLPSTSLVNESHVFGRDKDRDAILALLLGDSACQDDVGNQKDVCTIPIVGMGGIGKTTLAQLVYNDKNVKESFHVRAWICVSEEFDVFAITKTIFESVTESSGDSKDLNILQVSLQEKLSKSRFLLVLDDVWNESYESWDRLSHPFQVGLPGSRVIVTTRSDIVARTVSLLPPYHMKLLTDKDCLSLLAQHARRSFNGHPELEEVAWRLVKKCKGLPLAAKTLGGLLRAKESLEEWEDVLNSKIWDLPTENNILPVLRLSYHHLPAHLKNLFAYCSIFPKDYEFNKKELVLLWMAEGFLRQPEGPKSQEELGFRYFNDLLSRSFFQKLSGSDSHYVMHDLINELAHFVAGGSCYRLDEKMDTNQEYVVPEKARHASFLRHEYEVFRKFKAFDQVQGLRTFLPMPVQNAHVWPPFYLSNRILSELLPKLCSLRVLSLSGYSITELPSSICSLIHLRYLNLSGTSISSLPVSVSDLYNLQTLSIQNCRFINKLPSTLGDLVNLRHLDNSNTDQLKEMPIEIGKLTSLQTLPKVVVSRDGGLGLKELRGLVALRGTLAISELQNVTDIEDAKEASLMRKQDLDELELIWGNDIDESHDRSLEFETLDTLQPHTNLRKLKIEFYGGPTFASWIGDPSFHKLSCISLNSCAQCMSLPPLGRLPMLKHLRIGGMPRVKCIHFDLSGTGTRDVPFPSLETLMFDHMTEWEEWTCHTENGGLQMHFPKLRQLTIFKCPKLTDVSPLSLPGVHKLDLQECNSLVLERLNNLSSLTYVKIESASGLSHLPRELVWGADSLEVLECSNCNEMLTLWQEGVTPQNLINLRRLVIADCPLLVSLGEEAQQLPHNLEILELFRCESLMSLPNDFSNVRSLRELIIKNCPNLVRFPENGISNMLKRLEILSCRALESLPGDVSDLDRLEIKECSSLRAWPTDTFPTNIKKLALKKCNQMDTFSEAMFPQNSRFSLEDLSICDSKNLGTLLQCMHNFSNLVELYISNCDGLESFPEQGLPTRNLRTLSIEHCSSLKSLPRQIRSITSLVSLEIRSCRKLEAFPTVDFPPNLTSLRIWDSRKLRPLAEWGLHRLSFLQEFSICGGFPKLELLPHEECLLPSSLIKLSIARFPRLKSLLKVLENLLSLRHLSIMNCGKLNILPSEELLERLWHLEISDCSLLRQRCQRDRGDFWPKIAGIPCVEIDGSYIYRQSSD